MNNFLLNNIKLYQYVFRGSNEAWARSLLKVMLLSVNFLSVVPDRTGRQWPLIRSSCTERWARRGCCGGRVFRGFGACSSEDRCTGIAPFAPSAGALETGSTQSFSQSVERKSLFKNAQMQGAW